MLLGSVGAESVRGSLFAALLIVVTVVSEVSPGMFVSTDFVRGGSGALDANR